jgi:hypothetical protein
LRLGDLGGDYCHPETKTVHFKVAPPEDLAKEIARGFWWERSSLGHIPRAKKLFAEIAYLGLPVKYSETYWLGVFRGLWKATGDLSLPISVLRTQRHLPSWRIGS